jgi:hypothetical protein
MGAVSYIRIDKNSSEGLPDLSRFGGGYLDNWGSSFVIKKDDEGRLLLSLETLGDYLHQSARNGWENDSELKAIQEKTFNGAVMQWGNANDHDIQYHFHNNELIGIGHAGILIWSKDNHETIEQYVELCHSYDRCFFEGGYCEPLTRFANEEDKQSFPLKRVPTTTRGQGEPRPTITFSEKTSKATSSCMEAWAKQILGNK